MLVETTYKNLKGTILYVPEEKRVYYYDLIIPEGLVKDLQMPKSSILRYHTSSKMVKKIRKEPTKEKLKKDLLKFLKGKTNGK